MERKTAEILGYKVDLLSFDEALKTVLDKTEEQNTQTVTINPEMIALGEKNQEFSEILKNADLVIPDGFGIKLALMLYGIKQQQIPGIEFSKKLIAHCAENSLPVALIGAKEETIQKACENLKNEYPNLKICYKKNGYFKEDEERAIIDEMKQSCPKLVLAALGVPKQEIFINKYKNEFQNTMFVGVGGSFDVWAGNVKRAPLIFRKLGCEWLWRLIKEPSRFNRMFPTLPLFVFKVIMNKK
ncbi:MAG: WecB/TagA/CpsF family glycosyltransferase [Candidatus Gastranaerophilales bacterium]|nr:WecB/TagA/CpsF family glycosyltransferase [Candidatus Gastranaerophilales bacterium]